MNKPIAWINEYDEIESFNPDKRQEWIPLYTHPAKTLTDEEIEELAEYHGIDSLYETGRLDFAKAILRKAVK
jgi:hypothetical protein